MAYVGSKEEAYRGVTLRATYHPYGEIYTWAVFRPSGNHYFDATSFRTSEAALEAAKEWVDEGLEKIK